MRKFLMILMAFLLLLCTACTGDFSDSLYVPDDNVDPNDPNRSTLTIKYLYEDGTEAAETVRGNIYAPNHYLIRSPKISGYESNLNYVSVTANGEDIEKVVTYTKEPEKCSCGCRRSTYVPIITPSVVHRW